VPSVNRLVLIGRLGRSPELRYTPEGQAVTHFSLATDRPVKAGAERETDWHQVVSFGKVAEFAGQYLDRGRLVCVIGRITYRSWEGRDGQTRRMTEIIASDVVALDHKPNAEGDENAPEGNDEAVG
jgi:single-strand DNA-binding protein